MTTTRWLTTDDELDCYLKRYRAMSHAVTLDYLQRSDVRGFFDRSGRMIGGYAIHRGPDLRYLAAVPVGTPLPARLHRDRLCEITCIWFDPSMRTADRLAAYARLIVDLLGQGRCHVLGGSTESKIARIQRRALPHLIYEGPVRVDDAEHWGWVYYGSWSTMVIGLARDALRRAMRSLVSRRARTAIEARGGRAEARS